MHVVAVSFGEPLRDELGDDPLELPVDELDTLRAVRVDVPGDELPGTVDDLRLCPSCTVSLRSGRLRRCSKRATILFWRPTKAACDAESHRQRD